MSARRSFVCLGATLDCSRRLALLAPLLAGLLGCASPPPPKSQPSPLLGDVMPSFESTTLNGNPVMSGAYEGHKLVLSFVGVKCEPCERVLSAAQAVYSSNREVVVVGVFQREGSEKALSTAARLELRFPVVVDRDGSLAKHFHIEQVPSTFVVNERGRVSWLGGADVTEDGLNAALHAAK